MRTVMVLPSALSSTVSPDTAWRRVRVAPVSTSWPLTGSGWEPKPPKPKWPRERWPKGLAPPGPPNMRKISSYSSRVGAPVPEVEKRTLPPPNIEEKTSSKPPAPPPAPEVKRALPPAMERMASYCWRSLSSDRTA